MKKWMALLCASLLLCCAAAGAEEVLRFQYMMGSWDAPTDTARFAAAEAFMQQTYPGVKLEVSGMSVPQTLTYEKGHIPEDTDILMLRADAANRLARKGSALYLREELAGVFDVLPDYPLLTGQAGEGYILPVKLKGLFAGIESREVLAAVGLHAESMTWQQVFDAAPKLEAYNRQAEKPMKMLCESFATPIFISQFYWDEVKAPTAPAQREKELKALLAGWKNLDEMNLLTDDMRDPSLLMMGYYPAVMMPQCAPPPACRENGSRSLLMATVLVVNAQSPRKDAALAFLRGLYTEEAVKASANYLMNGVFLRENPPSLDDYSMQRWEKALEYGCPESEDETLTAIYQCWGLYRRGKIGLEECVQGMLKLLP